MELIAGKIQNFKIKIPIFLVKLFQLPILRRQGIMNRTIENQDDFPPQTREGKEGAIVFNKAKIIDIHKSTFQRTILLYSIFALLAYNISVTMEEKR